VNYDDLKKRDEAIQRNKLRRLRILTAAFALLAVAATGASFLSWNYYEGLLARFEGEEDAHNRVTKLIESGRSLYDKSGDTASELNKYSISLSTLKTSDEEALNARDAALKKAETAFEFLIKSIDEGEKHYTISLNATVTLFKKYPELETIIQNSKNRQLVYSQMKAEWEAFEPIASKRSLSYHKEITEINDLLIKWSETLNALEAYPEKLKAGRTRINELLEQLELLFKDLNAIRSNTPSLLKTLLASEWHVRESRSDWVRAKNRMSRATEKANEMRKAIENARTLWDEAYQSWKIYLNDFVVRKADFRLSD